MKIFRFLPQMTSNSPAPIWGQVTYGDLGNYFIVIIGPRASFWYEIWLCLQIFQFLTRNDPKYSTIWGQVTSSDLGHYFFVIIGPRASFWYTIWLCLKTFGFDPKCPPIWGQVTSSDLENHFFVITVPGTSFWHLICIGLKMFGFWPQMTPNTPRLESIRPLTIFGGSFRPGPFEWVIQR